MLGHDGRGTQLALNVRMPAWPQSRVHGGVRSRLVMIESGAPLLVTVAGHEKRLPVRLRCLEAPQ